MPLLLILPLMGALIGWGTNLLAIRSLFRPVNPIKIPLTPWAFQGLIPKRKKELAFSIGALVEKELVNWGDLLAKIDSSSFESEIMASVNGFVRDWVEGRLPRVFPRMINSALQDYFTGTITKAFREKLPEIMQGLAKAAEEEVNIGALVEEKIEGMTLDGLEGLVFSVARQELKQIEYLGAFIGFLIGVAQSLLVYFWSLP